MGLYIVKFLISYFKEKQFIIPIYLSTYSLARDEPYNIGISKLPFPTLQLVRFLTVSEPPSTSDKTE